MVPDNQVALGGEVTLVNNDQPQFARGNKASFQTVVLSTRFPRMMPETVIRPSKVWTDGVLLRLELDYQ